MFVNFLVRALPLPLITVGLLPNLLLGLVAAPHGTRALVNVEYLVLAAAQPLLSRAMLTVLLALTMLTDVIVAFAPVFNFGPGEVIGAVEQIQHLRGRALAVSIAIITITIALAILCVRLAGARPERAERPGAALRVTTAAAAAALIALLADVANGSNPVLWRARTLVPMDVATSMLAREAARALDEPPPAGDPVPAATDALRALVARDGARVPPRIVLVIVESMGLPRGASLDDAFAPLISPAIRARYNVRTGTVPFTGATTSGEFRELCGVRLSHLSAQRVGIPECLPTRLAAVGYRTVALHAYAGTLFGRRDWYPQVGFQDMQFVDELRAQGANENCGVMFNGPCDQDVLRLLRDRLAEGAPDTKELLYWLTLTSHFPLDPRAPASPRACAPLGNAGKTPQVCALWSSVWPVLEGIAGIAGDTTLPRAWYIVVGDHAPPLLIRGRTGRDDSEERTTANRLDAGFDRERQPFSQTVVPFIELRPRPD